MRHCAFEIPVVDIRYNSIHIKTAVFNYSSVPNRRVGQNKRAGGKILKKH